MKTVVIGLDGATFTLLDPWISEGILPNFGRLATEGIRGALESVFPPHSGAAWASFMTGQNPGKHGVFGFHHPPDPEGRRTPVSLSSIGGAKFWDLAGRQGARVGIVNLPMTYPPQRLEGFMVSGLMTPDPSAEYTWPPDLKRRIESLLGRYLIEPETERFDPERPEELVAFLDHIREVTEARLRLARHLMTTEAWDCFVLVLVFPDRIQHRCWRYLDPQDPLSRTATGRRIRLRAAAIFTLADQFVGEMVAKTDAQDCLVISDHGFGPLAGYLNVNRILRERGYLVLKEARGHGRSRSGPIRRALKAVTPSPLWRALRRSFGPPPPLRLWQASAIEDEIDWERTRAYFPGFPEQGIYLNRTRLGAGEAETLRSSLRDLLLGLTDAATGAPLVDRVFFREEIYAGPRTERAPDLFFVARGFTVWGRPRLDVREYFTPERGARGYHQPDGILLGCGPRLRRGARVEGARLLDLAPTLLHLLGLPVPDEMDGRVLEEILAPEFLRENPVRRGGGSGESAPAEAGPAYTPEDEEAVNARLRALGYIE